MPSPLRTIRLPCLPRLCLALAAGALCAVPAIAGSVYRLAMPGLAVSAVVPPPAPAEAPLELIDSAWDPALTGSPSLVTRTSRPTDYSFGEGNRVAQFSAGIGAVGAAKLPSTGKWYWEVERVFGAAVIAGIGDAPIGPHTQPFVCGMEINTAAVGLVFAGTGSSVSPAPGANAGAGTRFGLAYDATARTLHMYHGAAYRGSCSIPGTAALYITVMNSSSGDAGAVRAHFKPEHQTLGAPAGYTAGVPRTP